MRRSLETACRQARRRQVRLRRLQGGSRGALRALRLDYSDRAPPQALLYRGKHRTWVCPDSFVPRGELRTRVGEHRTRVPSIRVRTLGRAPAASPAIPWSGGTLRRKLPRWWLPSFFVAVDVLAQERAYLAHHDAQARQSKYAAGDQHERETVREQRLGDSETPRDTSQ